MTRSGFTTKPCHGCGTTALHKKDALCWECAQLLELGTNIAQQEGGKKETYQFPWGAHMLPRLKRETHKTYSERDRAEIEQNLRLVFYHVVQSVSTENPATVGNCLFNYRDLPSRDTKSRIFPQGVAPLLHDLYYAIQAYCNVSYVQGYQDGSNLIGRLAQGELSADEVNAQTIKGRH